MANFLGNPENIASGWGPPPKLDAAPIGGLVGEILQQRRYQQALQQKNIAEAIKNVREERQSAQYLDAMKAAGLIPEDYDAGGAGGAKHGTALAVAIQRQKREEAMDAHRKAMEARIGRGRGGRGGGGDEATQVEAPEGYYGLSVAPGIPTTKTINGIVHVRTPKGVWKPGPKWMQPAATPQTDVAKTIKQQFGNRFSPEDFNPETVTIEPQAKKAPFDTPSTVTTGTGRKMSLGTFQAGVKAMHGGQQADVGGYSDTEPPNAEPPADVPDQVTPDTSGAMRVRPDASKGAPVNTGNGPAQGGYVIGKTYQGMRYLGGDPNDQSNWQ